MWQRVFSLLICFVIFAFARLDARPLCNKLISALVPFKYYQRAQEPTKKLESYLRSLKPDFSFFLPQVSSATFTVDETSIQTLSVPSGFLGALIPKPNSLPAKFPDHTFQTFRAQNLIDNEGVSWSVMVVNTPQKGRRFVALNQSTGRTHIITKNDYVEGSKTYSAKILRVSFSRANEQPIGIKITFPAAHESLFDINEVLSALAKLPTIALGSISKVDLIPSAAKKWNLLDTTIRQRRFRTSIPAHAWFNTIQIFDHFNANSSTVNHEAGHTLHFKIWGGAPGKLWKLAAKLDGQSVSDYGDVNLSEDFAEAFKVYFAEPERRAELPHRFALIDTIINPNHPIHSDGFLWDELSPWEHLNSRLKLLRPLGYMFGGYSIFMGGIALWARLTPD